MGSDQAEWGAMDLSVLFLGTAGSVPTRQRGLPSLLVRRGGDRLLFDCGEGTQRQLLGSIGLVNLREVFITHFHADHYLGLAGMLKSFDLRGRDVPITVYGPRGLGELFGGLRRVFGRLGYPLELEELEAGEVLNRDAHRIATYPTDHTAESLGYVLVEDDRPGRFDAERATALGIPPGPDFGRLQAGEAIDAGGRTVQPDEVMGPPRIGRKLALTGDTAACEATRIAAHGADLLIHDGTFADEEAERGHETKHATAREAAEIAVAAEVKMLAITHLSTRYFGPELRREAREVFRNTVVPRDFDLVELPFPERGDPVLRRDWGRQSRAGDQPESGDATQSDELGTGEDSDT